MHAPREERERNNKKALKTSTDPPGTNKEICLNLMAKGERGNRIGGNVILTFIAALLLGCILQCARYTFILHLSYNWFIWYCSYRFINTVPICTKMLGQNKPACTILRFAANDSFSVEKAISPRMQFVDRKRLIESTFLQAKSSAIVWVRIKWLSLSVNVYFFFFYLVFIRLSA